MTTYTRIVVTKFTSYILFDDDVDVDFFKEINGITESEDVEVTVDPNNCIKLYTYDNEYDEKPTSIDDQYGYEFANDNDADAWLEYNNGDGHQNCVYAVVNVVNGVDNVEYVDD